MLLGLAVIGCGGFQSPVFTPKPKDYPCHHEDGSAAPEATSCFPVDGTHTCCMQTNVYCDAYGGCTDSTLYPSMTVRRKYARVPERPAKP